MLKRTRAADPHSQPRGTE